MPEPTSHPNRATKQQRAFPRLCQLYDAYNIHRTAYRLPHFSTRYRPGKVLATLTPFVIIEMMKPLPIPEFEKKDAP